ncbi:MAG: PhoPQ-activated pathogenicity-related family protein [Bryobacterales bacterium]|nr:PhoPQ-activated pathogenicity-related family protein [Bryobacterales bacterium]
MRRVLPIGLFAVVAITAFMAFSGVGASARVEEIPDTPMASGKTPLDVYVQTPDPAYRYEYVQAQASDGVRASLLRMTSQEWLTEAEVNRTKWEHYLWIYTPANVRHETGLLFISGGANDGKVPKPSRDYADLARKTASVVTELRMVPNQPLVFKNDDFGPRKEDEMIAYGWRQYLEGSKDPKWLARLPMTKAAVRAMDTVTAFSATEQGGSATVGKFVVAGGSKRGWTTWTTAAVDKRVVAAIPIVIDTLNVEKAFVYHYRKYGFWATAVGDYFREGIMDRIDDPEFRAMMAIVDPYAYRARYTMPKFMVNGSGDQFFRPESSRFYYPGLPGEKHLRYVPNAGHNVSKGTDAFDSIKAFYQAVVEGQPRPELRWTVEPDGALRVTSNVSPKAVRLWAGTNPKYNDFRIDSAGPIYRSTLLEPVAENTWVGRVEKPAAGFTAYFVEAEWSRPQGEPFKFSTEVLVNPETFGSAAPVKGKTVLGPEKQQ